MSYKNYIKSQVKHHRCVICAKTFGSHFDKTINTFPVYHTSSVNKNVITCENVFFNEILRMYWFLHETGESMSMKKVIEDFEWSTCISMKKEMIEWCIGQGYFKLDSIHRLQVPEIVLDECSELFCNLSSNDYDKIENAVALIRGALRCFSKDLEKPPVCGSDRERLDAKREAATLRNCPYLS